MGLSSFFSWERNPFAGFLPQTRRLRAIYHTPRQKPRSITRWRSGPTMARDKPGAKSVSHPNKIRDGKRFRPTRLFWKDPCDRFQVRLTLRGRHKIVQPALKIPSEAEPLTDTQGGFLLSSCCKLKRLGAKLIDVAGKVPKMALPEWKNVLAAVQQNRFNADDVIGGPTEPAPKLEKTSLRVERQVFLTPTGRGNGELGLFNKQPPLFPGFI